MSDPAALGAHDLLDPLDMGRRMVDFIVRREVGSINDVTPQAHNGCRPPKRRRV